MITIMCAILIILLCIAALIAGVLCGAIAFVWVGWKVLLLIAVIVIVCKLLGFGKKK